MMGSLECNFTISWGTLVHNYICKYIFKKLFFPLCSCTSGYYGNPQRIGDICRPCHCNPEGSRSQFCDINSGQCPCRDGISGRTCEACTDPDYGLENGACVCMFPLLVKIYLCGVVELHLLQLSRAIRGHCCR